MDQGLTDEHAFHNRHPACARATTPPFNTADFMQLTDEQKQKVTSWIEEGLKLSEIQDRLDKEFGVRLTYMDTRLLVDDLKLTPKDAEPPQPAAPAQPSAPPAQDAELAELAPEQPAEEEPALGNGIGGKVSVSVDQLARPGAMVSGKVTFSDGQKADWYMDQYGRLGLSPAQQGYRPPQSDIAEFQMALDRELAKMGL
jgi:hypothetical protein